MGTFVAWHSFRGYSFVWDNWIFYATFFAITVFHAAAFRLGWILRCAVAVPFVGLAPWIAPYFCQNSFVSVDNWRDGSVDKRCTFKFPAYGPGLKRSFGESPFGPINIHVLECLRANGDRYFGLQVKSLEHPTGSAKDYLGWLTKDWKKANQNLVLRSGTSEIQDIDLNGYPAKIWDTYDPSPAIPSATYGRSIFVASRKTGVMLTVESKYPLDNDRETLFFFDSLKMLD